MRTRRTRRSCRLWPFLSLTSSDSIVRSSMAMSQIQSNPALFIPVSRKRLRCMMPRYSKPWMESGRSLNLLTYRQRPDTFLPAKSRPLHSTTTCIPILLLRSRGHICPISAQRRFHLHQCDYTASSRNSILMAVGHLAILSPLPARLRLCHHSPLIMNSLILHPNAGAAHLHQRQHQSTRSLPSRSSYLPARIGWPANQTTV